MTIDGILGRALHDPETGLPNAPYFALIRDWEERRARRRKYSVRVLDVLVRGGGERVRQLLSWRIREALRRSDLVSSEGRERYKVLLTSPDAERADAVQARLEAVARAACEAHPDEAPPQMTIAIETDRRTRRRGR